MKNKKLALYIEMSWAIYSFLAVRIYGFGIYRKLWSNELIFLFLIILNTFSKVKEI